MADADPSADGLHAILARNLAAIRAAIAAAARRAGRDPETVTVIAASKTVAPEALAALPGLGVRDAGENRVQEAEPKVRALSDLGLRWHMIGRLQTNKVRRALDLFHRFHSVDRDAVMIALAEEGARRGRTVDCLVQVNVSDEETKGGYGIGEAEAALRRARTLPSLRVTGLMAIPAPGADPEASRPAFRALRALRDRLREGPGDLPDLSMGMSGDYAVAVEEGATLVRLGTALFGGIPARHFGRAAAAAPAAGFRASGTGGA
jgi:pyridoxal phosphate enzyme (YggS family)